MVGNEGEKSFVNLFAEYYGETKDGDYLNADTTFIGTGFYFIRSGYYGWYNGDLYNRAGSGDYWSIKAYSGPNAYYFDFNPTWLGYQAGSPKGFGLSLRCVANVKGGKMEVDIEGVKVMGIFYVIGSLYS